MIDEVWVYDPSGKLQKVISQKALYKGAFIIAEANHAT